jgi:azurin
MADWSNAIIGHMQHHLRDPNRDQIHGRIYRITYEGRPLLKAPKIDGQPIEALLELLKEPENQTRELAKIELDKHDSKAVIAAVKKRVEASKADPNYEPHVTEALWVHQWHDAVDPDLLKRVLTSPEPRARAAAVRVLCYWRDRVPDALVLLKQAAYDDDARVRLQAVRAASYFDVAEAVDVALEATRKPLDYYLEYTLGETLRQLQPQWQKSLADGKPVAPGNPQGIQYLLSTMPIADLLKLPRNSTVLESILTRPGVLDTDRLPAANELAEQRKTTATAVLLDVIDRTSSANAIRLLPMQLAKDLKAARDPIAKLAATKSSAPVWAALATADGSFDAIWTQAKPLSDLLDGIPLILDPDLRAQAFPKVSPLLAPGQGEQLQRAAIAAAVSISEQHKPVADALAKLIASKQSVGAAARGLRAIPMKKWANLNGPVARDLVAWAKTVPDNRRAEPEYLDAIQLASDLAAQLPADEATSLRRELKDLRVAVFSITALREQMRYDTTTLVVEAGKPFEIIFENTDFMPHNLVVVKPGSRPKIGAAALKMTPDELDGRGRAFVPKGDDVLGATKLLEAGQRESLKMKAINREGVYEYVCTYPGHWEQMWGTLIVTKDVDAYVREAPRDASPAHAHPHSSPRR